MPGYPNEYKLNKAEHRCYTEQGFLIRESQFGKTEIERLRAAAQRVTTRALQLAKEGSEYRLDDKRFVDKDNHTIQFEFDDDQQIRVIEPIHTLDRDIDALVDDPRLSEPMRSILGRRDIALWTGKMNLKSGHGSGFDWHQDSPYWIHDSSHVDLLPNVMVTLNEQSDTNGCFRVIAGSHLRGLLPGRSDGSQLAGFYTDDAQFDLNQEVRFSVPAGSLIFFDPHIVHGSRPNETVNPRNAMIFTYQPSGFPLLKTGEIRNVLNHQAR